MRQRLDRGRLITRLRDGTLPRINAPGLHLELDEIVYLDVRAAHLRLLASGPRRCGGRLVVSNRKIRFLADAGAGSEQTWTKLVSADAQYGRLVVQSTSTRGGGTYELADAEYAAAVLTGALRVAKRLVIAPGTRDSRAIPQDIKAAVWQRDGGACTQCGAGEYLEFDHVIPHSRGGATSLANLQLLCRRCNGEKGARI